MERKRYSFYSISAFNYHIMKEYSHYIQINLVGAKKPETGVTGFGVAIPAKGIGIRSC